MIQKIKTQYKIEYIAARACGGLKKSSNDDRYFVGHCPFCDKPREKSRKFWVDTKLQCANCYRCKFNKPLDVINLYANLENITINQAIKRMYNALPGSGLS